MRIDAHPPKEYTFILFQAAIPDASKFTNFILAKASSDFTLLDLPLVISDDYPWSRNAVSRARNWLSQCLGEHKLCAVA